MLAVPAIFNMEAVEHWRALIPMALRMLILILVDWPQETGRMQSPRFLMEIQAVI